MSVVGIFGVRGGGTSAIAGVVKLLGFKMYGEDKTIDDNELLFDIDVIDKRSGEWAFKHPFLTEKINDLKSRIDDLKCIYVFRDPVASANHGAGKEHYELTAEDHALQTFMLGDKKGLYISYEIAMRYPYDTVRRIAEFINRPFNENAVKWLDPTLKYRSIADYETYE